MKPLSSVPARHAQLSTGVGPLNRTSRIKVANSQSGAKLLLSSQYLFVRSDTAERSPQRKSKKHS